MQSEPPLSDPELCKHLSCHVPSANGTKLILPRRVCSKGTKALNVPPPTLPNWISHLFLPHVGVLHTKDEDLVLLACSFLIIAFQSDFISCVRWCGRAACARCQILLETSLICFMFSDHIIRSCSSSILGRRHQGRQN